MLSKIARLPRRSISIQSQLILGTGVILVLASLIALMGYLNLRALQVGIQTTVEEASWMSEHSLKIENEFLLARQSEADFLAVERSRGLNAAMYADANKQRLAQARAELDEMKEMSHAAHDAALRSLSSEIAKLAPLLDAYETAFLATVAAMEKRGRGGLESALDDELEQLETGVTRLPNPEFRLLIVQIRADERAYLGTGRQEYVDNIRLGADKFTLLLKNSPSSGLTVGGAVVDTLALTQHISNYLACLTQLVELDQDIETDTTVFREVTADINQVTARIVAQSEAGLARARAELQATLRQSAVALALTAVLALGLGTLAAVLLARRISQPLKQLSLAARQMGQGRLDQPVTATGAEELEILSNAFNGMAGRLRQIVTGLESTVAERTRDLERRAAQVAAGAEIARVATSLLDPDQVIVQAVELIQARFDFYYVGLFLLDADGHFAVLQAGSGQAGRVMKESGHRLEVGGQSMVGWACANKQARIALDVGKEAVRFANPLLPDTRSEMALPLRVSERVIGALDVQSAQAAAFDEGDIAALHGMADQIAVALENARLFRQTQQALKDLDEANRLLTLQGWKDYLARTQGVYRAEACSLGIQPVEPGHSPFVLHVPLELRGLSVGTLVMERSEDSRPWTGDEAEAICAIAQQAMLAVDNARLFEEAQRLAARERLTSEITTRIRSAATLQGVLESAVHEIGALTGASHAVIELDVTGE